MEDFLSKTIQCMATEHWVDQFQVSVNAKLLYDALTHINHNTCPADEKAFTKWFVSIMMWCLPHCECEMIADEMLKRIRGEE
jgi:hypothetical protein